MECSLQRHGSSWFFWFVCWGLRRLARGAASAIVEDTQPNRGAFVARHHDLGHTIQVQEPCGYAVLCALIAGPSQVHNGDTCDCCVIRRWLANSAPTVGLEDFQCPPSVVRVEPLTINPTMHPALLLHFFLLQSIPSANKPSPLSSTSLPQLTLLPSSCGTLLSASFSLPWSGPG